MRIKILGAVALLAIGLAGCKTNVGAEIVAARDFLSDTKTQAAIATVERGATIAVCDVSKVAGLTADAIASVSVDANGKPLNQGAQKRISKSALVATASSKACEVIGGIVASTVTAAAATPVVTVQAS